MKAEKFKPDNILSINELNSELELQKAQSLIGKFSWMKKEDPSLGRLEKHLINLVEKYEEKHWANADDISDDQVEQSDLAEWMLEHHDQFIKRRKEIIRNELKERGLKQKDLAKFLARRATHLSEQLNGFRQFSRTDIRILNRVFNVKLEDLFDPFMEEDTRVRVKEVISEYPEANLELKKEDLLMV